MEKTLFTFLYPIHKKYIMNQTKTIEKREEIPLRKALEYGNQNKINNGNLFKNILNMILITSR